MLLPLLSTAFCTDVTIANFINVNLELCSLSCNKKKREFLGSTALHDASYIIISRLGLNAQYIYQN